MQEIKSINIIKITLGLLILISLLSGFSGILYNNPYFYSIKFNNSYFCLSFLNILALFFAFKLIISHLELDKKLFPFLCSILILMPPFQLMAARVSFEGILVLLLVLSIININKKPLLSGLFLFLGMLINFYTILIVIPLLFLRKYKTIGIFLLLFFGLVVSLFEYWTNFAGYIANYNSSFLDSLNILAFFAPESIFSFDYAVKSVEINHFVYQFFSGNVFLAALIVFTVGLILQKKNRIKITESLESLILLSFTPFLIGASCNYAELILLILLLPTLEYSLKSGVGCGKCAFMIVLIIAAASLSFNGKAFGISVEYQNILNNFPAISIMLANIFSMAVNWKIAKSKTKKN